MKTAPFSLGKLWVMLMTLGISPLAFSNMSPDELALFEKFAFSKTSEEKTQILRKAPPGSAVATYLQAIQAQQTNNQEEFDKAIFLLEQKLNRPDWAEKLRLRKAIINWPQDQDGSQKALKELTAVSFSYPRPPRANAKSSFPSILDSKLIDPIAKINQLKNSQYSLTKEGWITLFESKPLISDKKLQAQFLQKIDWLPSEKWVDFLIEADKNAEFRFQTKRAIKHLLLEQLNYLEQKAPELAKSDAFCVAKFLRSLPADSQSWARTPANELKWLENQWDWLKTKPSSLEINTIKSHLLERILALQLHCAKPNKTLFLAYLQIARETPWISEKFRASAKNQIVPNRLPSQLSELRSFFPQNSNQLLVDLLKTFLIDAQNTNEFSPYLQHNWLENLWAEANLLEGKGNTDTWTKILGPQKVAELTNKTLIDFLPTNPSFWKIQSAPVLNLSLKNTPKLLVRTYELNTQELAKKPNLYFSPDQIDINGLTPNSERSIEFKEIPLLKHNYNLELPELANKKGIWIIELIANGCASKTIISKGAFSVIEREIDKGVMLTIIDQAGNIVPNAELIYGTRKFKANEKGSLLLPFSAKPSSEQICYISKEGFSYPIKISSPQRVLNLKLNAFFPANAVQAGKIVNFQFEPTLFINGQKTILEQNSPLELTITLKSIDGNASTITHLVPGKDLGKQLHLPITIPQNFSSIDVSAQIRIPSLTPSDDPEIVSDDYQENSLTSQTSFLAYGLNLIKSPEKGWIIEARNRAGILQPNCLINVTCQNNFGIPSSPISLATDKDGRVYLGNLTNISSINSSLAIQGNQPISYNWNLSKFAPLNSTFNEIKIPSNKECTIPVSLIEGTQIVLRQTTKLTGGVNTRLIKTTRVVNGSISLPSLPEGYYEIATLNNFQKPEIKLISSLEKGIYDWTKLPFSESIFAFIPQAPATLGKWEKTDKTIKLQVDNAKPGQLVLISAQAFAEPSEMAKSNSLKSIMREAKISEREADYFQGAKLSEEARYILDRQQTTPFPGVMLQQPGILLNPWAINETTTSQREAKLGVAGKRVRPNYTPSSAPIPADTPRTARDTRGQGLNDKNGTKKTMSQGLRKVRSYANTFLDSAPYSKAFVVSQNGEIEIPLAELEGYSWINAILFHDNLAPSTSSFAISSKTPKLTASVIQKQQANAKPLGSLQNVLILSENQKDLPKGNHQILRSVSDLFQALQSAIPNSPDNKLSDFAFLTRWNTLPVTQKEALVKQFASHELNLFIWKKDKEFFNSHILPVLKNKRIKQLVDDVLLGNDLSPWLNSAKFDTLNPVEKALLAAFSEQKTKEIIAQQLIQAGEANPISPEIYLSRFLSAMGNNVQQNSLTTGGYSDSTFSKNSGAGSSPKPLATFANEDAEILADSIVPAAEELMAAENDAAFYQSPKSTQELAESQWFKLRLENQQPRLFAPSQIWAELATGKNQAFLPKRFLEVANDWRSSLVLLALMDLPFEAKQADKRIVLSNSECELNPAPANQQLQLNQHYFLPNKTNPNLSSSISPEKFEAGTIYGMVTVVGNPTSQNHTVTLQSFIPAGAIAVFEPQSQPNNIPLPPTNTATKAMELAPYSFQSFVCYFMFPNAGNFESQSTSLTLKQKIAGFITPQKITVHPQGSLENVNSWEWIASQGSNEQVLAYLTKANPDQTPTYPMLWRLSDKEFYQKATSTMHSRMWFDSQVDSFSLLHKDTPVLAQWLLQNNRVRETVGPLNTNWIKFHPEKDGTFEVFDYAPYINSRILPLGGKNEIPNDRFRDEYESFISLVMLNPQPKSEQWIVATTYLILQDRIQDALNLFARIKREELSQKVQYDYLAAWLSLAQSDAATAEKLISPYQEYPNLRWRERFQAMQAQIAEIKAGKPLTEKGNSPFANLTSSELETSLSAQCFENKITISSQGVNSVTLRWFPVNLEFMFSNNPFLSDADNSAYSLIQPSKTSTLKLEASGQTTFDIPKELNGKNAILEIANGNQQTKLTIFANSLSLAVSQNAGQILVRDSKTLKPIAKSYVKVYAKLANGQNVFYKDGYTDLRGRFDYASLTTNKLNEVKKFSLLVITPENGSIVKEILPPAR